MMNQFFSRLLLCVLALLGSVGSSLAQPSQNNDLEKAIASLRHIQTAKMTAQEQETKAKQIDESWKLIIASGQTGLARIKQEIRSVDAGTEKDDFFKLNAAVLLWQIGKLNEAESIAAVWNSTPLTSNYNYVFYPAMDAAKTQNVAALPMLKAVLKDDQGSVFFSMHSMNVPWPLSHEFIWGAFGPQGLPVLAEILEKSNDEVELKSAISLLAKAQYLPALPRIRQLASSEKDQVRRQAIQGLGQFGHPTDFDRLAAGLRSIDPNELFSYAFALYEFDDERAVKPLIPLLEMDNDNLKVEVSLALLHLLTPESFSAVKKFVAKTTNAEVKEFLGRSVSLRAEKLPKDFQLRSRLEQAKLLAAIRNDEVVIAPGTSPITNAQLLQALKIWKEKGRIYDSGSEWVGVDKMIASAKPENMDLLLSTKASFYPRLSDECLYEVRDFDTVIKHVGRSRYRAGLGVTEKAELK